VWGHSPRAGALCWGRGSRLVHLLHYGSSQNAVSKSSEPQGLAPKSGVIIFPHIGAHACAFSQFCATNWGRGIVWSLFRVSTIIFEHLSLSAATTPSTKAVGVMPQYRRTSWGGTPPTPPPGSPYPTPTPSPHTLSLSLSLP